MSEHSAADLHRGVVVEYDFVALPGHGFLFDICRERLGTDGVVLDEILMSRMMNGKSFSAALGVLSKILDTPIDASEIVSECYEAFVNKIAEQAVNTPAAFFDFTRDLLAQDIKVIMVTRSTEKVLLPVFIEQDCGDVIIKRDVSSGFGFYSWDAMTRAAESNKVLPRLCAAVVASGYTAKSALVSGMGVVAKPNLYTDYQDFSGSDAFCEEFSKDTVSEILRILHRVK